MSAAQVRNTAQSPSAARRARRSSPRPTMLVGLGNGESESFRCCEGSGARIPPLRRRRPPPRAACAAPFTVLFCSVRGVTAVRVVDFERACEIKFVDEAPSARRVAPAAEARAQPAAARVRVAPRGCTGWRIAVKRRAGRNVWNRVGPRRGRPVRRPISLVRVGVKSDAERVALRHRDLERHPRQPWWFPPASQRPLDELRAGLLPRRRARPRGRITGTAMERWWAMSLGSQR